jgi:DNA-binding MarR family transcriptional regulator
MQGPEKSRIAERMAELTIELLEQCQVKQERIADNLGLTVAEFKLLRVFRNDTMVTAGDLARRMQLSSSRLTRILDGLVRKEVVTREVAPDDRRVVQVRLTERGGHLQRELSSQYLQTHVDILELLPDGAGDSVIVAMEKLRDALTGFLIPNSGESDSQV